MASFSRKRKFDESFSISSINCSKCSQKIRVEATSNVKAECRECLFQSTTENGGFPFEMVGDEHQLQKDFQCPICLLIIRDATELPCNHLMCKSCLVKNESRLAFFYFTSFTKLRLFENFKNNMIFFILLLPYLVGCLRHAECAGNCMTRNR